MLREHPRTTARFRFTVLHSARSSGSDGVQHLSAVHQRVFRLQQISETVELLEPGVGVMLAVRGMIWDLDRDGVLDHVRTLM